MKTGPLAIPTFDFSFMFFTLGIFTTEGENNNNKTTIYKAQEHGYSHYKGAVQCSLLILVPLPLRTRGRMQ